MTWKDYGFTKAFDMVLAAYVADEPVVVRFRNDSYSHSVDVLEVTPTSATLRFRVNDEIRNIVDSDVLWARRWLNVS